MIRVVIIDDSALVRSVLKREIDAHPQMKVVGVAPDPFVAREIIVREHPDVITLDLEMPRMDGITFLQKMMKHFPVPTIVVSSLAPHNSEMALAALECGAVDVVGKPSVAYSIDKVVPDLLEKILAASTANVKKLITSSQAVVQKKQATLSVTTNCVIAIGSSTGGTRALEEIIPQLPLTSPGVVIVQHMPAGFTKSFSERLNTLSAVEVKEAENGDAVIPGRVLVAPGNFHMVLQRDGARYTVKIIDGEPVHHQCPSVEVLFQSVAATAGKNSIGIILTGMGSDGATGLNAMKDIGAVTFAQDEETSVVWGMPGEAVKIGAAQHILPLRNIIPNALQIK